MDMRSTKSFRSKRKAITPGEETNVRTEHGPPQPARTTTHLRPRLCEACCFYFPPRSPRPFPWKNTVTLLKGEEKSSGLTMYAALNRQ